MAARLGLAEVLRAFAPAYLTSHTLSPIQARAWRAIVACRTAALGGHVERCDTCGTTRHVYHSCRNRHCPLCQTRGGGGMARRAPAGAPAGAVFSCRVHAPACAQLLDRAPRAPPL